MSERNNIINVFSGNIINCWLHCINRQRYETWRLCKCWHHHRAEHTALHHLCNEPQTRRGWGPCSALCPALVGTSPGVSPTQSHAPVKRISVCFPELSAMHQVQKQSRSWRSRNSLVMSSTTWLAGQQPTRNRGIVSAWQNLITLFFHVVAPEPRSQQREPKFTSSPHRAWTQGAGCTVISS